MMRGIFVAGYCGALIDFATETVAKLDRRGSAVQNRSRSLHSGFHAGEALVYRNTRIFNYEGTAKKARFESKEACFRKIRFVQAGGTELEEKWNHCGRLEKYRLIGDAIQ